MLVLPLGLGTKVRRWPVVTMALALVWILVYATDRSDERMSGGLMASAGGSRVRQATKTLFVQYCREHRGRIALCQRYARLIWTGLPAKLDRDSRTATIEHGHRRGKAAALGSHHAQAGIDLAGIDLAGIDLAGIDLVGLNPWGDGAQLGDSSAAARRFRSLRSELSDCGSSPRCFQYKEMVWAFLEGRQDQGKFNIVSLPGYEAYRSARKAYLGVLQRVCAANDCLMRGQITPRSLLMAQLRHDSLMHLLANLCALLLFGLYVEQRGSRWLYLGALLIGGSTGMGAYAALFGSNDTVVLGGSALVCAVMGMFYVFFFHSRMRFLVWLPRKLYRGTRFSADVRYCFPLFFILIALIGGLDSGYSELAARQTAHMAHAVSFAVGMLCAYLIGRARQLPRTMIYEDEANAVEQLRRTAILPLVLQGADDVLSHNPDNIAVREVACGAALSSAVLTRADAPKPVRMASHAFLREHLTPVCAVNAREGSFRLICRLLTKVPMGLPLAVYLDRLGAMNILRIADFALAQAHMLLAVRLYDLYLIRYPLSHTASSVEASAADAVARLPADRQTVEAVEEYLQHHARSLLAPRLAAWLTNNDRRTA